MPLSLTDLNVSAEDLLVTQVATTSQPIWIVGPDDVIREEVERGR